MFLKLVWRFNYPQMISASIGILKWNHYKQTQDECKKKETGKKTFNQEVCVPAHLSDTINKWSTRRRTTTKPKALRGPSCLQNDRETIYKQKRAHFPRNLSFPSLFTNSSCNTASAYIHTNIHTYIHTYIQTHIQTYTQTYIHKYTHTHTHTPRIILTSLCCGSSVNHCQGQCGQDVCALSSK